jgi:PAS domain S-box-containing protein
MSEVLEANYFNYVVYEDGKLKLKEVDAPAIDPADGVLVGDLWGYISDINDAGVKIYGAQDKCELVGKHVLQLVLPQERARAVKESLEAIAHNSGMKSRYRARLKSGEVVTVAVTTHLVKNAQGENVGFLDIIEKLK